MKTRFNEIEDVEFYLLEEIPRKELKKILTIERDSNFDGYKEFYCEVGNQELWYEEDKNDKGGFVLQDRTGLDKSKVYGKINDKWVILQDFMTNDFFTQIKDKIETREMIDKDNLPDIYRKYRFNINYGEFDFFNTIDFSIQTEQEIKDRLKDWLENESENARLRIEKEYENDKKEDDEKEKGIDKESRLWKEDGKFEGEICYKDIKIDKNILTIGNYTFTCEKNLNELFDNPKNISPSYTSGYLSDMEVFLMEKKISYSLSISDKKRKYKISFDGDNVSIDGVNVPKSKIVFFVLRANGTKERINLLKKLSGRAFQILELKNVDISIHYYEENKGGNYKNISIPFTTETDGNNWKVTIFSQTYDIEYQKLQDLFFGDNSINISHYILKEKLVAFCEDLGMSKKYLFDLIRKDEILKNLGGKDETE